MITKIVIKDFVAKRCPYLTKCELEEKSLIELIKNNISSLGSFNELIASEQEEDEENDSADDAFNLLEISKEYPHLKNDIKKLLRDIPKNAVEKLVEEYNDDQLVSKLSREFFESLYGKEKCIRCDVNKDGEEIINQDLLTVTTNEALANPNYKVIFEGQIEHDNLRARFDVLIRNVDGTFDLIEVKGTNNVTSKTADKQFDTKFKDKYFYDLLFQYYLYKQTGMQFGSIGFLTTNGNFKMSEEAYPTSGNDLKRLFQFKTSINLKDEGEIPLKQYIDTYMYFDEDSKTPQPTIEGVIEEVNKIAALDNLAPTFKSECKKGPACPFLTICHKDANDLNSIYKLTKWNLFGGFHGKSTELIHMGIEHISDIPDEYVEDKFPLVKKDKKTGKEKKSCARLQIDLEKNKFPTKYVLDFNIIEKILKRDYQNNEINYLIFFDFESFQHPVPLVKDSYPWKQVVSQYSMHVVKKDYDLSKHDFDKGEGGGIYHREFIGNPDEDGYENPSFKLYETLKKQLEDLGIDVYGNDYRVIVFNQNFEKTRMREFTDQFGTRVGEEMKTFVMNFNDNVVDLLFFFTDGGIYSRDFGGRGSLKVVQPNLTADPNVLAYYHSLDLPFDFEYSLDYHKGDKCLVFNGAICLDLYKCLLVRSHLGESHKGLNTKDLLAEALAYCKIDSWGTVIIYDIIKHVFEGDIKLDATIVNKNN